MKHILGNEPALFLFVVVLLFSILVFFRKKLSLGISVGYTNSNLPEWLIGFLPVLHFILALNLALILPNNYLNKVDFINDLFESSNLWIPFSMLFFLIINYLLIGLFITLLSLVIMGKKLNK